MSNDDEIQKAVEQFYQDHTDSIRLFDPDEYALEKHLDEVIAMAPPSQQETFLYADRELVLFEVFTRIAAYEKSERESSESLSDLLFSHYLISSHRNFNHRQ
ncbi:MAG: hypothetical protein LC539_19655 [Candidatus Thiodiazotropha sp.]|nr:hypothetical protein [Candidatus Thiodiazotropha sp.]